MSSSTPLNVSPTPERRRRPLWQWVVISVGATVLFLAWIIVARSCLLDRYVYPSASMAPTIAPGSKTWVTKAAYGLRIPGTYSWLIRFDPPNRGDVVVFKSPENKTVLMKRVIGVPGDEIKMTNGSVVLNGQTADITDDVESLSGVRHRVTLATGGGPDWGPKTIPAHRYFIVGDNRGNSRDSRFFGLIELDVIIGRAQLPDL